MDESMLRFLDDLHRQGREHDVQQPDRPNRYRNLEPDTARLLAALVRARAPQRLPELGTSNGYSTIWLADAARAVGGRLVSVDVDQDRSDEARANLGATDLREHVDLRVEDAASTLAASEDCS